ncbi:unnamed protein product [Rotaria sp. Silwood2]|nr:unnamed protein product [Rotaria sp. Silwood2]CAF3038075.1 unnamed protein product [Rotaria sp. Silwood2]CAF3377366.1 unnamed protein product [Rotaria sp. Silwood2]CAF4123594.1 unnamed protein product [Rotaria sp. Silwood2]CAF4198109.1 unnamed protein product [Rotaria sp. Silwood2]
MTIIENINKRFGSFDYFDVIYQSGGFYSKKDLRLASRYSPIMTWEHECWGYRCLPSVIDENTTILMQGYAYEMDLYHMSFSYNRVIAHIPICAEPAVFYPPVALNSDKPPVRDIDFLVVGARDNLIYPLRIRLGQMVKNGLIKNSYLHKHPGYFVENRSVEQSESQVHDYAALLRRAKIVVVDSSRYRYAINKYSEVALSGCLIVGDIPFEREEEFRRYVVQISMNMTDGEILSIIEYWIKNEHEREEKAALGQKIVLNSYTWDHNIDLSLQALINYRRGEFGIYHNYPYTMKCVPIDNTFKDRETATKWCSEGLIGMPLRSLCECNLTHMNYINDEPDLDNWSGLGVDVNSTNPRIYLIPTSLITFCASYKFINAFASQVPTGSACNCEHADASWRDSNICYISNTALTISRYLAYLYTHNNKIYH